MSFERYFRTCSYAMVACGVLALAVAGGVGPILALAFAAVLALSWKLTETCWQLSERAGMVVVLLALPAFYLDWNYQRLGAEDAAQQVYAGVSALVHFTLLDRRSDHPDRAEALRVLGAHRGLHVFGDAVLE